MILGAPSPCFVEIDEAVTQLQAERGDDRPVVFHWQADIDAIPAGAIVYNFDLPGTHFGIGEMARAAKRASEIWDFSRRGVAEWQAIGIDAKYAPIGYHASMTRFERVAPTVDVVFVGSINERRHRVLQELERAGLSVVIAPTDRAQRDDLLARCRCSINMRYYADGVYPMLRAAHLLANDVPYVGERCAESDVDPTSNGFVHYGRIVDEVRRFVRDPAGGKSGFIQRPMVLP